MADAIPLDVLQNQNLQSTTMENIGRLGLTTLGIGAGARGLLGMYNLLRRNLSTPASKTIGPVPVEVPFPVRKREKQAEGIMDTITGFMRGDNATTAGGIPWALPAAVGTGIGGLTLGWSAVDKVLDSRRKAQMQNELDTARQDFNHALLSQYDKPKTKLSQDLNTSLDNLYDKLQAVTSSEKTSSTADALGSLTGIGLTTAGLGTLASAMAVYSAMTRRSQERLLQSAQKRRMRNMYNASPTSLLAMPTPVDVDEIGLGKNEAKDLYNGSLS